MSRNWRHNAVGLDGEKPREAQIRINPLALSGITALQVEVDGANEWLLTTDIEFARQYLRDIQAKEVAVVDLVDVLEKQYGCVAVLATLG